MKKYIFSIVGICLVLVSMFAAGPVYADDGDDGDTQTKRQVKTVDSKVGGGFWADDLIGSIISIFSDGNTHQVGFEDSGSFTSWAGPSPGGTGTIGDGVTGTITGGMAVTVTGSLKSDIPADLGFIDFQCDHDGNCSNYVSWRDQLFDSYEGYQYESWGWTYVACGGEETWVNADSGNLGDITLDACPVTEEGVRHKYGCGNPPPISYRNWWEKWCFRCYGLDYEEDILCPSLGMKLEGTACVPLEE